MIPLLVATWYAGAYVGQPLYCGGTYAETTAPWVALPIQDKTWECGDLIFLRFENGDTLMARALDAGPRGTRELFLGQGKQDFGAVPPFVVFVFPPFHMSGLPFSAPLFRTPSPHHIPARRPGSDVPGKNDFTRGEASHGILGSDIAGRDRPVTSPYPGADVPVSNDPGKGLPDHLRPEPLSRVAAGG